MHYLHCWLDIDHLGCNAEDPLGFSARVILSWFRTPIHHRDQRIVWVRYHLSVTPYHLGFGKECLVAFNRFHSEYQYLPFGVFTLVGSIIIRSVCIGNSVDGGTTRISIWVRMFIGIFGSSMDWHLRFYLRLVKGFTSWED